MRRILLTPGSRALAVAAADRPSNYGLQVRIGKEVAAALDAGLSYDEAIAALDHNRNLILARRDCGIGWE